MLAGRDKLGPHGRGAFGPRQTSRSLSVLGWVYHETVGSAKKNKVGFPLSHSTRPPICPNRKRCQLFFLKACGRWSAPAQSARIGRIPNHSSVAVAL